MTRPDNPLCWYRVFWPRPLEEADAVRLVRGWASDQRSPQVVLEVHASAGQVSYLLGSPMSDIGVVRSALLGLCPGVQLVEANDPSADHPELVRPPLGTAGSLRASTRHRALDSTDLPGRSRSVLAALSRAVKGEHVAVQVILGPRRVPLAIPNQSPSSIVMPWWQVAWYGDRGQVDPEKRAALRTKVSEHGFACLVRIGAQAATPRRREQLVLGVFSAVRGAEAPGLQLRLSREPARRIDDVIVPWRWPLRLGVHEVLAIAGWPISSSRDDDLPGLPARNPRPLPPSRPSAAAPASSSARVVARSTAPGTSEPLTLSIKDQLRHLHVVGPTGVGKSTLLAKLVLQDIEQRRGLVVIDPKGDLVDDILARVPADRRDDVVVLDPADHARPVGFNPLAGHRTKAAAELAVDGLLAVFRQLWSDSWGPRTQDVLHATLLTLTRRGDASLVMLPLLLTNDGFRRSLVQQAVRDDPFALGPFWDWYDRLSDGERANVIAPVMNKLRAFLLRPSMRAVLGQVTPGFSLSQVFTERKVLLVSLSKGLVGPEASQLLGSLIVAGLWQATLQRAAVPASRRAPVHVVVDELQDYLHLPTDLADALAQARGLGVGFTLAHQYLGQLPKEMQTAVLANARSRICFQQSAADAPVFAKGHPKLEPADLQALGAYQVYASLHEHGAAVGSGRFVSGRTLPLGPELQPAGDLRAASRERWGQPVSEVEAGFAALLDPPGRADQSVGRRRVRAGSGSGSSSNPGAQS